MCIIKIVFIIGLIYMILNVINTKPNGNDQSSKWDELQNKKRK